MIESQTIAGPIAVARAFALPPAADLPELKPAADPFRRADLSAPFGPAPTFRVSYLERVWEEMRWPGPAPRPKPEYGQAAAATGVAEPEVDLRA